MKKMLVLLVALISFAPTGSRGEEQLELSPEAAATIDRALTLIEVSEGCVPQDRFDVSFTGRAAVSLAEEMGRLATQVNETVRMQAGAIEGKDIRAKLIVIASDKASRPEIYETLRTTYINGNPEGAAQAAPHLQDAHATEAYRLPWEYYLLSPMLDQALTYSRARSYDALEEIRNPVSLVTIVHAYKVTTSPNLTNPEVLEPCQHSLLALIEDNFKTEDGLRAILNCYSYSIEQQARDGRSRFQWGVETYLIAKLTDPDNVTGDRPVWRAIIQSFSREGLSAEQIALLDKVLAVPP